MSNWNKIQNVHMAIRLITGAYLVAFCSWTIYKYYKQRNSRPGDSIKGVSGDANEEVGNELSDDEDEEPPPSEEDGEENQGSDMPYSEDNDGSESESESQNVIDIEDLESAKAPSNESKNEIVRIKLNKQAHPNKRNKAAPIDYESLTEEQLNDRLRKDLSKQGYKLIESHSAVKMCRWTKNSMRGRGGCYKHTFYGIKSYQCMEMTPNLACASKCTFCWRHHKNPVGTEWKWKMDPPDIIVEQGLKNHLEMIRQMKGVPGVTKARFLEAHTVRHCALSLVGEPIFYPRINELLEILHARKISTFLVTNAQFPDAMRHLIPVTQLYVSIDAPNKQALKKIDRPLYKDFWERYIECLEIISQKKQRTVFRLTLVQKANMTDHVGYAKLIDIGKPDFIEIKGVTYCGTSKANKLTMENVPWHEQVVEFSKQLLDHISGDDYELACEHSHSNCVLLANRKFKINGEWHTWIDYNKFFELIGVQSENNHKKEFTSLDYIAKTPPWAIHGSKEEGFDPEHRRWIRKDHKRKLLLERIAAQEKNTSEIVTGDLMQELVSVDVKVSQEQNS